MLNENQDALDAILEAWTAERSPFEAMDALQAKGVAAAAVQHPEDRMDKDANSLEWPTFPEVKHKEMGRVRVEGMPMKLSKTPAKIKKGAPVLGEDNDFFYDEILMLDKAEQKELHAKGVI